MEQESYEKTPKKLLVSGITAKKTPISTKFFLLSNNKASLTPSPSLKTRLIRNPFENQLHEKLHLPVISSPSLFQHTSKQENKLEIFEWTIEELSNLNPVKIHPNETQFCEQIDPVKEAQAQAAISSFFQEQQIVPSPGGCNLRKQKITFRNDDENNSINIYNSTELAENSEVISKCQKIRRDVVTQTELSFPPTLPKEIEDLLKQFQASMSESKSELELETSNNDGSMMDISTLRKKLFITRPEVLTPVDTSIIDDGFAISLSPAPKTPELSRNKSFLSANHEEALKGNSLISSDMFGELSPIGNNDSSNNCSPVMSSNDISMTSDVGRERTPASRRCNKLKKKKLSESFSLFQNEFKEDDCLSDNKENHEYFSNEMRAKEKKVFARFDSGFSNEDSNNTMNFSYSTEFMQI